MKTTMMFRNIANPRRTILARLLDADEQTAEMAAEAAAEMTAAAEQPEQPVDLPAQTANPRRTTLMEVPPAGH